MIVDIVNWKKALETGGFDEKVGVKIAKLVGDDNFGTYITIIDPHKAINAHFHKHDEEYYHIISGKGEIHLKNIANNSEVVKVVAANESFVIPINVQHQLVNTSNEPLILMFSCPATHLGSDRHFR